MVINETEPVIVINKTEPVVEKPKKTAMPSIEQLAADVMMTLKGDITVDAI